MFEQLHTRLSTATYTAVAPQAHIAGLVQRTSDQLAALGATLTADGSSASTVAGAIGIAKAAVNAQAVTATFSLAAKQQALGKLDALAATLASALPGQ